MLVKQGDMGYFLLPFVLQHVLEFQARRELCGELRSTATGTRSIFIRKKKAELLHLCPTPDSSGKSRYQQTAMFQVPWGESWKVKVTAEKEMKLLDELSSPECELMVNQLWQGKQTSLKPPSFCSAPLPAAVQTSGVGFEDVPV